MCIDLFMASTKSFFAIAPEVVKRLRREREWSVGKLAQRSGVSTSTLHRIEKDGTVPSLDVLDKILNAFEVRNWVEMLTEFALTASRRRSGGRPYGAGPTEGPPLLVVSPGNAQNFPLYVQLGSRRMLLLLNLVELEESEQGELLWQG